MTFLGGEQYHQSIDGLTIGVLGQIENFDGTHRGSLNWVRAIKEYSSTPKAIIRRLYDASPLSHFKS